MKIKNVAFVLFLFIFPVVLTYFTMMNIFLSPLTYGLWLTMEIGFFTFVIYYFHYKRMEKLPENLVLKFKPYKVAAVVTAYNENPETVKGTLISVKNALDDLGDVFLLDDSTDQNIVKENSEFCKNNNIKYIHRDNRRGYKAGAINDFLKNYGKNYEILAIFDVDQRPVKSFFYDLLPFFNDPEVSFVQVPQSYTEIYSNVALGAYFQQKPFNKIVMSGRSVTGSAFILGSGVLIRISALEDVGYFDESVVTEDLATSLKLHEKRYKSIYVDYPGIWYGEPPETVDAYLIQQGRWSLGGFQAFKKIIKSDFKFSVFIDYFSGFLYWLKEGPLTIVEILAPVLFLSTRFFVLKVNPLLFSLAYFPLFIFSLIFYIISMKSQEYGLKGFLFHQFLELIMMPAVTLSFIAWITGRKRPFKVTPKNKNSKVSKFLILNIILEIILIISLILGLEWYFTSSNIFLKYSILVNLFWLVYFIFLNTGTFFIYFSKIGEEEKIFK